MNRTSDDILEFQWPSTAPSVVTTGTFDGFHVGHRAVADRVTALASERGLRPLAVTFTRHPLEVIAPERAPRLIADPAESRAMLRRAGLDVVTIPFNETSRSLTARDWLTLLRDKAGARVIVMGYDNTLGCDGRNLSRSDYADMAHELGLEAVTASEIDGASSSAVRKAVEAGDLQKAAALLGRPFSITGNVVKGRQIGRKLGFPTANISIGDRRVLPPPGVYAADVMLPDGTRYPAALNIGHDPSVAVDAPLSIEANIIGFSGDIYGKRIEVTPLAFLREERKFPTLEELKSAIRNDTEKALAIRGANKFVLFS